MEENKRLGHIIMALSFLKSTYDMGIPMKGLRRAPTRTDRRPKRPAGEKYSAKRGKGGGEVYGSGGGYWRRGGRVWEWGSLMPDLKNKTLLLGCLCLLHKYQSIS